jgi:hypothetical protein
LCILTDRDQPGALQDFEVLRDCRLTHRERFGELRHRCLAAREPSQNGATRGIGQREKRGIKAI